MAKFEFEDGEHEIGSWTINYKPPGGGRYNGKLSVTDQRLLYDAKFDTSVTGVLTDLVSARMSSQGYLIIPKDQISSVELKGRSKVGVTLNDGSEHLFDYGALLSAKKVAAAISA